MKYLILFTLVFFSLSSIASDSEPELIVRADIKMPKGLPVWSKMPSMSPSCSDDGVAVKYLSFFGDEKLHPAVAFFKNNSISQTDPLESDLSVSDLFITQEKSIVFSLNYRGGTKGVFELNPGNKVGLISDPSDLPDVEAMSRPSLLDGKVLFRALNKDGLHTIYHGDKKLLDEKDDIAYLYLPTVKNNQVVLKVGLGTPGEVSQTNKDKIISIFNGKEETVAEDQDLNPKSDFLKFDSSPIPDGSGGVAFIAEHKTFGRSLWLYKNKELKMIFESSDEAGKLEYFSPAVNESGSVVFRLIKNNRISVMGWQNSSQELRKLMTQGQSVLTNEDDKIRIIDRDRWPAFSGKPCITASGDVYIHAVLESSNSLENKGSGIFKISL